MIVKRSQLVQYSIPAEYFFAIRSGSDNYTDITASDYCRDAYFNHNSARLETSIYCAIGNDTDGWELEMYNGVNWVVVTPDTSYSLIITNDGLAALTNIKLGGIQLYFSGIKIINQTILNPATPIITWTDTTFMQAGEVVFSVGTNGAKWLNDENGNPYLKRLLRWRFNSSSGGLQYVLTLPPEGIGSTADDGSSNWDIGAIGLYIKDPTNNSTDILFAVATLPELVHKHASTVQVVGNAIKLYFNTVLTNLGVVSNLEVLTEGDVNLPEVQNESLLTYPSDSKKRAYNCYVVDNLYGTNMPALAVQRKLTPETYPDIDDENDMDWAWFQPADNFVSVPSSSFDASVNNYDFVYWDGDAKLYKQALGKVDDNTPNGKMPIGIRIGNSVVFSGTIINNSVSYQYEVELTSSGTDYRVGDELLIPVNGSLIFKLEVLSINSSDGINSFKLVGPSVGNIPVTGSPIILPAIYDPRSQLPRNGSNARFKVVSTAIPSTQWNFAASWLNKPIYCSSTNAGKVVNTETDSMIGWVIASNAIKLGLDLRNEATSSRHGTIRIATNAEVEEVVTNASAAARTAVCPQTLKNNYFQITKPANASQAGSSQANPVIVDSFVKFNQIVLGKHTQSPYNSTTTNPYVTDSNIDFYGCAYRAWYQDLAEYYEADNLYEPGTLIAFGGLKEITAATEECDAIISTKPGFELGNKQGDNWLPVALVGRTPVLFDGNSFPRFGDKIYLSKVKKGCASTVPNGKCLGKVIAKSFSPSSKLIECVVRIDF